MTKLANAKKRKKFLWIFTYHVEKPALQVLEEVKKIPCVDEALVGEFEAYGNLDRFLEVQGSQKKIRVYLNSKC